MESDAPVEDDDAWLYGDNSIDDERKEEINAIFDRATEEVEVQGEDVSTENVNGDIHQPVEPTENGEVVPSSSEIEINSPERTEDKKGTDDDDDSDDDVQITIGDIKPGTSVYTYGGAPVNLNIKHGRDYTSTVTNASTIKPKGIDLENIGVINGVPIHEFNLDNIEDKPWQKPGADITDYFNYGFNEDVWKAYCEKQRKLRVDNNVPLKAPVVAGKDQQIPIATVNENSKYSRLGAMTKKAGPPPDRRMAGSIDVICGTTTVGGRRAGNAKENVIQVMTGRNDAYDGPPGVLQGHLPPTHLPPPFIPPNMSVPPPGILPGIPPPSIPPPPRTIPGHVPFPDMYGNQIFSQPSSHVSGVLDNTSQYDEQYFTGNQTAQYDGHSESTHQSWSNSRDSERDRSDRDRNRDRDKERDLYGSRDHDRERSSYRTTDEDYGKRREDYERQRYREHRERPDKDRYEREYDRDKDEKHERERDRERRHREHRVHEDRHRERTSRRRRHREEEEEVEHHSSRHKHKKSKRDKDDALLTVHEADGRASQHDLDGEADLKSN